MDSIIYDFNIIKPYWYDTDLITSNIEYVVDVFSISATYSADDLVWWNDPEQGIYSYWHETVEINTPQIRKFIYRANKAISPAGLAPNINPTDWDPVAYSNKYRICDWVAAERTGSYVNLINRKTESFCRAYQEDHIGIVVPPTAFSEHGDSDFVLSGAALANVNTKFAAIAIVEEEASETLNSEFTTDISDWTDTSSGTGSAAWQTGGYARLTSGASGNQGRLSQTLTTSVGEVCHLSLKSNSTSTGQAQIYLNSSNLIGRIDPGEEFKAVVVCSGSDVIELRCRTNSTFIDLDYCRVYKEVYNTSNLINPNFICSNNGDPAEAIIDQCGWTDASTGTGTATLVDGNLLKLYRADSSNRGRAEQSSTGTSGETRYTIVKNKSTSSGSVSISANGTSIGTCAPGEICQYSFISDGNDLISMSPASNLHTDYVELCFVFDSSDDLSGYKNKSWVDIPETISPECHADLFNVDEIVFVGDIVLGTTFSLGASNLGASFESVEFNVLSKNIGDQWTLGSDKTFLKSISYPVLINKSSISEAEIIVEKIIQRPCFFSGNSGESSLELFGYVKGWNIVMDTPTISFCSLDVAEI